MEKIFVDFTVFETALRPYARICGRVEVNRRPSIGEHVLIVGEAGQEIASLIVEYISKSERDAVFGLMDIVASNPKEAQSLCMALEGKAGLECDVFDV